VSAFTGKFFVLHAGREQSGDAAGRGERGGFGESDLRRTGAPGRPLVL
jgi:hypothetical protein